MAELEHISSVLGKNLADAVGGAFAKMEIAEEEIADFRESNPARSEELWESFILLRPTDVMQECPEKVYREHCREILARVVVGEDTRPATDAEVILAMCALSQVTPVRREYLIAYHRAFCRVFGEEVVDLPTHMRTYDAEVVEADADTRRGLYDSSRIRS